MSSLNENDLQIILVRAQGDGVNTAANGILIKHLPTGLTATATDHKSRIANQAEALKELRDLVARHPGQPDPEEAEELEGLEGDAHALLERTYQTWFAMTPDERAREEVMTVEALASRVFRDTVRWRLVIREEMRKYEKERFE